MQQGTTEKVVDDEYGFFKEATLLLCSQLSLEDAMCDCVRYLQGVVPADTMFLQLYEPDLGAMRTVATATAEGGVRLDLLTPLPEVAWAYVREPVEATSRSAPSILIFNNPKANSTTRFMLRSHGIEGSSMLRMTLTTQTGRMAGIVLTARGPDRYTERDAHHLSVIKPAFAVSITNALEHDDLRRRAERLARDNATLREALERGGGAPVDDEARRVTDDPDPRADAAVEPRSLPQTMGPIASLDEVVAAHIRRALRLAGGKIHGRGGAGELLRVNPNTLRYRMRKLGIPHGRHAATA